MIPARQSTALEIAVGPVLDADGVAVTNCVVGDFKIKKTTGNFAALNGSATLTHVSAGVYDLVLTTSDTDTVGLCTIAIDDTVNACQSIYLQVLEEAVYDMLYAASATGYIANQPVDVNTIKTQSVTCGAGVTVLASVGTAATSTAQTGDSYAIVNSGTHGNAALKTLIDAVDNFIDTEIGDIQSRLPAALSSNGNMKCDVRELNGDIAYINNFSNFFADGTIGGNDLTVNTIAIGGVAAAATALGSIYGSTTTNGWGEWVLKTTIATLASQTSFTLTGGSTVDDMYNGCDIIIRDSLSVHTVAIAKVLDYVGSTKTVTLDVDPAKFTITTNDLVFIYQRPKDIAAILEDTGTTLPASLTTAQNDLDILTGTDGVTLATSQPNYAPATSAQAVAIQGATFDTATDSLEAIRNRGDAAWGTATGFSTLDAAGVRTAVGLTSANLDTQLADLPTVAEFEARTIVAADYFVVGDYTAPPSAAAISTQVNSDLGTGSALTALATQTSVNTVAGYLDTEVAAILAAVDTEVAAIKAKTDNLPSDPADQSAVEAAILAAWTTALTESYNADGSAPTPAQALFLIMQRLTEFAISGTTVTIKKLDGSTTAATLTLDDASTPTSSTRAS